jgi:hypothetical protein
MGCEGLPLTWRDTLLFLVIMGVPTTMSNPNGFGSWPHGAGNVCGIKGVPSGARVRCHPMARKSLLTQRSKAGRARVENNRFFFFDNVFAEPPKLD